jgi:DNA-binding GntR family transcriptional regulator
VPARKALQLLQEDQLITAHPRRRGFIVGTGRDYDDKPTDADLSQLVNMHGEASQVRKAPKWKSSYGAIQQDLLFMAARGEFRIVPANLASHYGITRTVLHDIQLQLIQDGLLTVDGRHWQLVALNDKLIRDQYEVRIQLEPFALGQAFTGLKRKMIEQFHSDLLHAQRRKDSITPTELDHLETSLHTSLLRGCNNNHLMDVLASTRIAHVFNSYYFARFKPGHVFIGEHLAVIEALLENNRDRAVEALAFHLQHSIDDTLSRLTEFRKVGEDLKLPFLKTT